jgi:hypothetical protein
MKIKKTIAVNYQSSYAWDSLDIVDTEGDEVTLKLTQDQWFDLESTIVTKCNRLRAKDEDRIKNLVNAKLEEREESAE